MDWTQAIPLVFITSGSFYLGFLLGSRHTYQAGQRDGYKRAMKKVERYGVDQ